MTSDEREDSPLIPVEDLCNSGIGLLLADRSFSEITINSFPISRRKSIEQDIPHIPDADRPIKVAKYEFFHYKFNRVQGVEASRVLAYRV